MSPQLSVIMSVYNGEHFLEESIHSILNQTFSDFEFIIINDGSKDASEKIILGFKDDRIRYIDNKINIGLIASLNKGLKLAKGQYIARMDDDDISLPTRFEKQVQYLDKNQNTFVLASKLVIINENGYEVDSWPEDLSAVSVNEIKQLLPKINCIGHPTVMMRSDCLRNTNYSDKLKHSEDWGLWLNLLSNDFEIAKLNEVLLKYRVHKKSTTVSINKYGVEKKIIFFKLAYIKDKLLNRNFRKTDYLVLKSLSRDILKYFLKPLLAPIFIILKLEIYSIIKQYFIVNKQLNSFDFKVNLIFVFPFYHNSGAEKVHGAILESINDKNSIVFITDKSENDILRQKFQNFSNVVEVNYLMELGLTRRWLVKKINSYSIISDKLTIMGCNSPFLYEMIPSLPNKIKFVDLVHAFVHLHEPGPEKWSLPVIDRLAARVVIDKNTKDNFEYFYKSRDIDQAYLSRIIYIPNFVDSKVFIQKNFNNVLKVLYVGRGSIEKRLNIIARVAFEIKKRNLPVEFHFAGNVKDFIPSEYLDACILHGNIALEIKMDELYREAHILIIASSREGFPLVIMEGMMQGVVPISTNVGGISEHVLNKENGVLIDVLNEEDIVAQFIDQITYYNLNRTELEILSLNAHNYSIKKFNKETFFNSHNLLLK